ncbi:hypothetical protein F4818DRAFT_225577 [Hypoxylon cercidicola]|nr:hypothetical protein F4818DRAFT_225577 [Hypoxylon cercidicola]
MLEYIVALKIGKAYGSATGFAWGGFTSLLSFSPSLVRFAPFMYILSGLMVSSPFFILRLKIRMLSKSVNNNVKTRFSVLLKFVFVSVGYDKHLTT